MTETSTSSNYCLSRYDTSSDNITFTYTNQELGSTATLEVNTEPGRGAVVLQKGERCSAMMIDDIIDYIFHNGDILS